MPYKPETRSVKSNSDGKVLIFIQYNNTIMHACNILSTNIAKLSKSQGISIGKWITQILVYQL